MRRMTADNDFLFTCKKNCLKIVIFIYKEEKTVFKEKCVFAVFDVFF